MYFRRRGTGRWGGGCPHARRRPHGCPGSVGGPTEMMDDEDGRRRGGRGGTGDGGLQMSHKEADNAHLAPGLVDGIEVLWVRPGVGPNVPLPLFKGVGPDLDGGQQATLVRPQALRRVQGVLSRVVLDVRTIDGVPPRPVGRNDGPLAGHGLGRRGHHAKDALEGAALERQKHAGVSESSRSSPFALDSNARLDRLPPRLVRARRGSRGPRSRLAPHVGKGAERFPGGRRSRLSRPAQSNLRRGPTPHTPRHNNHHHCGPRQGAPALATTKSLWTPAAQGPGPPV